MLCLYFETDADVTEADTRGLISHLDNQKDASSLNEGEPYASFQSSVTFTNNQIVQNTASLESKR